MCFRGTKQGKLAQQRHERLVASLVEEEYKKHCVGLDYNGWPPEEIECYNRELRKIIESKIRDSLV